MRTDHLSSLTILLIPVHQASIVQPRAVLCREFSRLAEQLCRHRDNVPPPHVKPTDQEGLRNSGCLNTPPAIVSGVRAVRLVRAARRPCV